jgi:hypothetical protein
MLIEFGIEWTFNQSFEFKVMNSLSTPRPKTNDEHCWYFVPCINIKEDEDTYAFNRILVQHGAKLKWETRRMGWYWFLSLNTYGMTPVFFPLVLNHLSVEWKLFNKVCDLMVNWCKMYNRIGAAKMWNINQGLDAVHPTLPAPPERTSLLFHMQLCPSFLSPSVPWIRWWNPFA